MRSKEVLHEGEKKKNEREREQDPVDPTQDVLRLRAAGVETIRKSVSEILKETKPPASAVNPRRTRYVGRSHRATTTAISGPIQYPQ